MLEYFDYRGIPFVQSYRAPVQYLAPQHPASVRIDSESNWQICKMIFSLLPMPTFLIANYQYTRIVNVKTIPYMPVIIVAGLPSKSEEGIVAVFPEPLVFDA